MSFVVDDANVAAAEALLVKHGLTLCHGISKKSTSCRYLFNGQRFEPSSHFAHSTPGLAILLWTHTQALYKSPKLSALSTTQGALAVHTSKADETYRTLSASRAAENYLHLYTRDYANDIAEDLWWQYLLYFGNLPNATTICAGITDAEAKKFFADNILD